MPGCPQHDRGRERAERHADRSLERSRRPLLGISWLTSLLVAGCSATLPPPGGASAAARGPLAVVAEGPCPKLSMFALGQRRLLVYGDTGYDLRGWEPGDELAAAQSLAELREGRWVRDRSLLEGLPTNEGGYVPAEMVIGGLRDDEGWLLLVTTRYAPFELGVLFDREVEGYRRTPRGWQASRGELPVDLPSEAASLPPLDLAGLCGLPSLRFLPLAAATSPAGGVFIAGQCDDRAPAKHRETTLLVAHGRPGATSWSVGALPETHDLDASVNVDLVARSDGEAYASVVEPFTPRERRHGYLARYDGERWQPVWIELGDGIMGLASSPDGTLWAAAGRGLYRTRDGAHFERVELPALRFAEARPEQLHVHTVRALGPEELWVEASYRVALPAPQGGGTMAVWASALYGNTPTERPLYCDAQKPAAEALFEVEP